MASALRLARRTPLLFRFGVVSLVVVVGIGLGLGVVLSGTVRDRAIADAARTGEVAANVGVRPFLEPEDLTRDFRPLPDERLAALDESLGSSLSPGGIVRLKVWNRQHWVVYSDNTALRTRWFAGAETLEQAFAGEITSEITDLSAPEEREEREFGELLAVYIPLRVGADGEFSADETGEVVGAFEIYLPFAPIAAAIRADTNRLWAVLTIGLALLYLSVFRMVASASRRLKEQAEENLHLASHDSLTGLMNRDAFVAHLATRATRLPRPTGSRGLATADRDLLLLCDLDGFQTINDTLGHDRGDRLLRIVGERIATDLRPDDVVARMGGDEYAVLLHDLGDDQVDSLVARLLERIEEPVELDGLTLEVRATFGAVRLDDAATDGERLLQQADIAMYAAKSRHSRLEFFRNELDNYSSDALALASEIRVGIGDEQFILHYQPKLDLASRAIIGAEALVRWNHPTRGFVPPGDFIGTVEQLPIGRLLTDHVLTMAVAEATRWHTDGRDLSVSVNLSTRDIADPTLADSIARLLADSGLPAGSLVLELTESTLLVDLDRALETLGRLRSLGCGVAIDDFGTGYASLSYLSELPLTELKIDQSFVTGIELEQRSRALVEHCISIGHSLGLAVTAEGIETEPVLELLADMGCDTAQGYFIARPMPREEFLAFTDEFSATTFLREGNPST
ncbi:MAG: EAL domain-containing protein [Acidimicrobiales bacterium]